MAGHIEKTLFAGVRGPLLTKKSQEQSQQQQGI